jgi:hypothetical protein
MVPSQLVESYASFSPGFKHSSLPPSAPEIQMLHIPNLAQELEKTQKSTHELARELLCSNPLVKGAVVALSPLWDMVRFRLLWAKDLVRQETRELIVELHLLFL